MLTVKFIGQKPKKQHQTDFAYDLYAKSYEIKKTKYGTYQVVYYTDLKTHIPSTYGIKIAPRSSISKTRLRLVNPEGIIDSGYRGEWLVVFDIIGNLTKAQKEKLDKNELLTHMYKEGERIAQCYPLPNKPIRWIPTDKLKNSERNEGGFGSTGNK